MTLDLLDAFGDALSVVANVGGSAQVSRWMLQWLFQRFRTAPERSLEPIHESDRLFVTSLRLPGEPTSVEELAETGGSLRKLDDDLFYDGRQARLKARSSEAMEIVDSEVIRRSFLAFPRALKRPVVLAPVLSIKAALGKELQKDPGAVLIEPQPYRSDLQRRDQQHIPVLFFYREDLWIGWQKRAMVASMLDCEFLEASAAKVSLSRLPAKRLGSDRPLIDLPAFRSHLLSTDRNCRVRVSRESLEFESSTNRLDSFLLPRDQITGVHLDTERQRLKLLTRAGKYYTLEAKPRDLRQVREALVEL